jgi:hypothetical protein
MRADMKYVVIERGRRGGHGHGNRARPRRKGEEWEGYLKHEGMRLPYGDNPKESTDLLGPLWRYLRKHVGEPWDVVYADICRSLDFRSVLGFHIKAHLLDGFGGVQRHVEMRGGVPYERVGSFGHPPAPVDSFYVHPETGLLLDTRSAGARTPRAPEPAPLVTRKIIDDETQLHWIHGAWFEVTLAAYGSIVPYGDVVLPVIPTERHYDWRTRTYRTMPGDARAELARLYGRSGVYAARKRQLSKREKRRYGLVRTPAPLGARAKVAATPSPTARSTRAPPASSATRPTASPAPAAAGRADASSSARALRTRSA